MKFERGLDMMKDLAHNFGDILINAGKEINGWNPLSNSFSSVLNLNCPDVKDVFEKGTVENKGSICPHSKNDQECFRGSRCYHDYHIDKEVLKENPKLAQPEEPVAVTHFNFLPEKIPMQIGTIITARIVNAPSPEEFYMVPISESTCVHKSRNYKASKRNKLGDIMNKMKEFYGGADFKNASSFAPRELVVVKMVKGDDDKFYRGVVTREVVLDREDQLPDVPVYLMDLGSAIVCKMNQVAPLAPIFCKQPQLAYKCYLNGISPLYLRYSKLVCQRFQQLVEGKEVLLVCCKRAKVSERDLTETEPYLVDLRVRQEDGENYVSVKEELVKTGRVLTWNLNIYEPEIWDDLSDMEYRIAFDHTSLSSPGGYFTEEDIKRMEESLEELSLEVQEELLERKTKQERRNLVLPGNSLQMEKMKLVLSGGRNFVQAYRFD